MKEFHDACDRAFAFLEKEFGLTVVERTDKPQHDFVEYRNATTAVSIERDVRMPGMGVSIVLLDLANLPRVVSRHGYSYSANVIGLDGLLEYYGAAPAFALSQSDNFDVSLARLAEPLKKYGSGILAGDRSIAPDMVKMLEEAVKAMDEQGPTR